MADCICVRRGDGPEGCGICNETGVATPPAMSAVHIGDAGKMAHVLRGMVNRGTLIDAEAIDRALTLAVYRQDPDDDDRAWAASQAEVIGQPVVPVGSGDADNEAAPVKAVACQTCKGAHPELCSNVFHISHPAPIKPSGDTEKLRDDVLERLRVLDFAGHYDEARFQYIADTILDLIQSEKAG